MEPIKGRGSVSNQTSSRFKLPERAQDGDWMDVRASIDGAAPPLRTSVTELSPRTILSFNQSPDIPFDRSINAYNGCDQHLNGCTLN
ncbi:radical SAM protein [Novosphingobium profundi]|uniref:radical SAM protein n=1 Tax=Novosphingobium profundi TaxID=1774954 RepID=UPI001BDA9747|nr:radical SAM protein [Novosphingobium profundi]MBT0671295.1 radical SAM protein [Novosphingobium profundi]